MTEYLYFGVHSENWVNQYISNNLYSLINDEVYLLIPASRHSETYLLIKCYKNLNFTEVVKYLSEKKLTSRECKLMSNYYPCPTLDTTIAECRQSLQYYEGVYNYQPFPGGRVYIAEFNS